MVNADWSNVFEVIILRESSEDNLIICYYVFEELLFLENVPINQSGTLHPSTWTHLRVPESFRTENSNWNRQMTDSQ